ncbi:unnamed protein product [Macrosiphum euphorbiae]|uniref:HAT C-terminal dimerisation domain-containing protein n=1 Tax=Macrosiphum euphorbiae TaxID=13131 RepID=A0AAV0XBH1_9HEMI|nr:unnamed protein product [Macrosiphum euphorbiae]
MTTSKAKSFVLSICDTDFIFALTCLSYVLERTLPLSKILQSSTIDLKNASEIVQCTIIVLQSNRTNCISEFAKLYSEVQQLASGLDIDLKIPRINKKQTHRENYNSQSIDEYYCISMFIPLLDSIIEDLKRRFTLPSMEAYDLSLFIPTTFLQQKMYCTSEYQDRVSNVSKRFSSIEPNILHGKTILGELEIWCQKWKIIAEEGIEKCPDNAIEAFSSCNAKVFPNIKSFLQILSTMPVGVASAERSFSTLRRMKTWLRSGMGETRLTGLCLLHVHREVNVNELIQSVIERFANKKQRRLDFVL